MPLGDVNTLLSLIRSVCTAAASEWSMCHLYGCLWYRVKETTALIMVLNVSFAILIILLSWGIILITRRWFKSRWQQFLLHFNLSKKSQSQTHVCICTWNHEREKLFLNSGKLRERREKTTTQHPNDSIIRSIIAVIILFIWGRAYKEGPVKTKAEVETSLPLFHSAFPCLICLFLMKRRKARTVERKRCQDWGRPPPSQGQTRGVNTWCPTLHINSAELITLIKQTHILSELRWPIAAS